MIRRHFPKQDKPLSGNTFLGEDQCVSVCVCATCVYMWCLDFYACVWACIHICAMSYSSSLLCIDVHNGTRRAAVGGADGEVLGIVQVRLCVCVHVGVCACACLCACACACACVHARVHAPVHVRLHFHFVRICAMLCSSETKGRLETEVRVNNVPHQRGKDKNVTPNCYSLPWKC